MEGHDPRFLIERMLFSSLRRGYLAPEYASYGELSEKADIYSFGVLCLEIISSRKNIDQAKPPNQVYLPSWVIFKFFNQLTCNDDICFQWNVIFIYGLYSMLSILLWLCLFLFGWDFFFPNVVIDKGF